MTLGGQSVRGRRSRAGVALAIAAACVFSLAETAHGQQPPVREIPPLVESPVGGRQTELPAEIVKDGKAIGRRVKPAAGDICAECNHPVGPHDVVYQAQGQRIAIHQQEVKEDVTAQVLRLLAQIRPRGAFLGAAEALGLSPAWFFAGLYVLAGLVFGALAAQRALNTGYGAMGWFAIAFALTLPGYLYLLTRPRRDVFAPAGVPRGLGKIARTYSPQACPACGAENHPSASACSTCGGALRPQIASELERAGLK
jgi:hypothetical protein